MTDYTVVSPPRQSNVSSGYDPNSAFADAVQRARQIAAKIHTSSSESASSASGGVKRPLEDSMDNLSDAGDSKKKIAAVNDPFGAQLAAMQQQQRGLSAGANVMVEEYKVPDKMVGLIIGRGGEQITRLQAESGCKIQMAPDSGGAPDRQCTLTGTRQALAQAKDMLNQIINRGGGGSGSTTGGGAGGGGGTQFPADANHVPDGQSIIEIMIPGGKVGLVIGKGGETIRNLQETTGVKMVLIQDGPQQTPHDKPLRITGDAQKCEFAKQMVMDLISDKNDGQRFSQSEFGAGAPNKEEVMVPRQAVGVVIGKGGDMIRRIQQDSGAKVQFHHLKDDDPGDRLCVLSGTAEQVQMASSFIRELIHSVIMKIPMKRGNQTRDQHMTGGGRGRGRGRGFGGPGGPPGPGGPLGPPGGRPDFGPGPRMMRPPQEDMQEVQYSVPAAKCGLVIGKGGETIRGINQQSGAHVELSRGPPPSPHEKIFVIRGNPQQIEHAQQLINERVGSVPPGPNGQVPPGPYPTQYPQPYGQQPPAPAQPYAPQGWGNAYQHWQNQPAAPNDPTKAAADANAAAWAAFYAQYYNQQAQQPQQPPQQPAQPQPQPAPAAAPAGTGQPDYSAAWAEYYRSLGMFREAEAIEQQARANQQAQAGQQYAQPGQQPYTQQPQAAPVVPAAPAVQSPATGPAPTAQPPQGQQPQPTQPPQPPTSAAPPAQPAQPQVSQSQQYPAPAPAPAPVPAPGPAPGPGAPPSQWPPAGYPQPQPQQNPYGQQQNPYPAYNYTPYGGQQQYPGTTQ